MTSNFNLPQLIGELEKIKAQSDALKIREGQIKDVIFSHYANDLSELYAAKDEPFGAASIVDGGYTLTFTTPKKVEWDQDKLGELYAEIGETASEYMSVSYKVKETAFKNWPSAIQEAFIPARTISPGAVSMKWKGGDNE